MDSRATVSSSPSRIATSAIDWATERISRERLIMCVSTKKNTIGKKEYAASARMARPRFFAVRRRAADEANRPTRSPRQARGDRGGDIAGARARLQALQNLPHRLPVVVGGRRGSFSPRRTSPNRSSDAVGMRPARAAAGSDGHRPLDLTGRAARAGGRFHFGVPDLQGFPDRRHCLFGRIFGLIES